MQYAARQQSSQLQVKKITTALADRFAFTHTTYTEINNNT